ncbi:MAG: response regulator transcription factor [Deltaproteobacteria bacterium]|nr:response regulator transcription factor [Deltaproteobacteria bacterium]
MTERVLLIDDDDALAGMVSDYLGGRGLDVSRAADGPEGLAMLARDSYDAVVLDVMMPGPDGFEVLRTLRATSSIPVVMLTARGDDMDRIVGLEMGADDYLPKPFNPRELLARLRAVLRRSSGTVASEGASSPPLRFGRLEIDVDGRRVRVSGEDRPLTGHQFELLLALARSPGRALTRDEIMQRVRGENLDAFDRSIDVHISRIRAAIEDDPKKPRRIITLRGVGYLFARSQD